MRLKNIVRQILNLLFRDNNLIVCKIKNGGVIIDPSTSLFNCRFSVAKGARLEVGKNVL